MPPGENKTLHKTMAKRNNTLKNGLKLKSKNKM